MRVYVLCAVLLAVCGWGYLQTKKLSDSGIATFYQSDADTTGKHDADASCALLADDFRGSTRSTFNGHAIASSAMSRTDYCSVQKQFYDRLAQIESRAGRSIGIDYHTSYGEVAYTPDHRSATVQVTYEYSLLGGKLMHITGTRTDTLVKRDGKVLLTTTDDRSTGTVGGG